jgi:hypothetical protein
MCGSTAQPVYVHGHSQCASCKINIDPCCGGAPLDGLEAAWPSSPKSYAERGIDR